jgi:beta-mannosidase
MGTLYWQLNDTWPVASWSSIDYFGRRKALHYMARRFYSPLLVSGVEDVDSGSMEIHVTSDLTVAERGEVRWIATDPEGVRLLSGKVPVDILPGRDLLVKRLNLRELIKNKGSRNILIWLELLSRGKKRSENLVIFARPKHLELPRPRFSLFVSPGKEGKGFLVELSSDRTALWCRLEPTGGDVVFSDNFFHMRPGIKKRVEAVPLKVTTLAAFKKRLRIFSLVDTF